MLMPLTHDLSFAGFRIDVRAQQLWAGPEPVALRPRTWQLLIYLVTRPGELVPADALADSLWPGVAVTPKALTNLIGDLRRALGDVSVPPRLIVTVHRRGYRLNAEVRRVPFDDSSAASPGDICAPRAAPQPFVGREFELGRMSRRAAEAAAGVRQHVSICGEAGMGKTALLDHFTAQAGDEGWLVARGQGVDLRGDSEAFGPVLSWINSLCSGPRATQVEPLLRRYAPCWLMQLPWLHRDGELARLRQELGGSGAGRMARECMALLDAVSALHPVLLVVEDVHWADPATLDLLAQWAAAPGPARQMLLTSSRPADEAGTAQGFLSMARRKAATGRGEWLDLPPLHVHDIAAYLRQRYGGPPGGAPTLASSLLSASDGHPLFVVALLDHLEDLGWLSHTDDGWRATEQLGDGLPQDVLPRRLAALIEERAAGLDADTRHLLEAASSIGLDFAVPLLASVCDRPVLEVERRCSALARQQVFLRPAAPRRWSDGREVSVFGFKHELYRRSLLEALPAGERRHLHERVARSLESAWRDSLHSVADVVAAGYVEAALPADAVRVLQIAASVAAQRFAYREASQVLQAAQRQLELLPDTPERARDAVYVHLTQASVTMTGHGLVDPRVQQSYQAAAALAERAGTPTEQLRALMGACMGGVLHGEYDSACGHGEAAVALAEVHRPSLLPMASTYLGLAEQARAHLPASRKAFERALAIEPEPGLPLFIDIRTMATFHLGRVMCLMGDIGEGCRQVQAAECRARADAVPFDRIQTLHHVADLWRLLGRREAARAVFADVLHLAERHALDYYTVYARAALWGLDRPSSVPDELEAWMVTLDRTGDPWGVVSLRLFVADTLRAMGGLSEARRQLDVVKALEHGVPMQQALLHEVEAGLLAAEGADAARVDTAWTAGLGAARAQGARLFQLRLALGRWRWRRANGEPISAPACEDPAVHELADACTAVTGPEGLDDWMAARAILRTRQEANASVR